MKVYGIDLGTTYSCIAYVDDLSGKPVVVPNREGELTTPSVVLFEDVETRVVGREAKNTAVLDAGRVVEMVKRHMGVPNWRSFFDGREYSPEEISSYILRTLVDDAEESTDARPGDVVIACPAYFGISEREATASAGRIAGLNVLEIINEPTAAAIAYGLQDERDQVVVVYDLGGGTFDVTMIEIKDGSVTVIATGGDHDLGGRNWDELVVSYLAQEWMRETGSVDDPVENTETLQDLWQRAETAKRILSSEAETKVVVNHDGQRVGVTLTREKFDELTGPLLERTIQYTGEMLEIARELGYPIFDQVLLVGGSTKMPQVAKRLRKELGMEPRLFDPDLAIAKGAALYALKLTDSKTVAGQLEGALPEVIITAIATSALVPFVQSLAAKAAEDVYTKLRRSVARKHHSNLEDHLARKDPISIADEVTKLVLDLPRSLDPSHYDSLHAILDVLVERTPDAGSPWLRLYYDQSCGGWLVATIDSLPNEVVKLEPLPRGLKPTAQQLQRKITELEDERKFLRTMVKYLSKEIDSDS